MNDMPRVAGRRLGIHIRVALCAVFMFSKAAVGMTDNLDDDVQCIVVGARLSNSADPNQRLAGQMFLVYFLGRIDGRWPNADLERLLNQEANKESLTETNGIAKKCGARFSARGAYLERIGKSLLRAAK